MRRKIARPYGQPASRMRVISMLMAMLVLWMLYDRLKDPATWRAIADDRETKVSVVTENDNSPELEALVPGPNDLEADEVAAGEHDLEAVDDKVKLQTREMAAYWRLMKWSRTQSFDELEKRAKDDVPFTQLWDEPKKYRGKLIRLRLHIVRVLEHIPEDSPGIAKVYEAWGPTDESRSFPYLVVFSDAPPGLPIGTDVRAEIVFVGYFLKVMSFRAFDNARGAPLLVGRVKLISTPKAVAPSKLDPWIIPLVVLGATAFIGFTAFMGLRARRKPKSKMLPSDLSAADSWSVSDGENPFGQFGADPSPIKDPLVAAVSNAASQNEAVAVEVNANSPQT